MKYIFDASSKTIEFLGIRPKPEQILLVTNVTDGIIIYNPADIALKGTLENNILTLTYNTSSMDDTDILQIYIDLPTDESLEEKEISVLREIVIELQIMQSLLLLGFSGSPEDILDKDLIQNIKNNLTRTGELKC